MEQHTRVVEARELAPDDVLVNPDGLEYVVTKTSRIGRGVRVVFERGDGSAGKFTAAPDSRVRVLAAALVS